MRHSDTDLSAATVERHPLKPFLPEGARLLMLGSFPPQRKRWSMDFFYPNIQNDMWRIFGIVFFGDKDYFYDPLAKRFRLQRIVDFLTERGIAIFDTASEVRRLKGNASDKFLEVVRPTDVRALLAEIPQCKAIVVTGQKASDILTDQFHTPPLIIGRPLTVSAPPLHLWRMPSSSRSYPMKLELKAEAYGAMFRAEGLL